MTADNKSEKTLVQHGIQLMAVEAAELFFRRKALHDIEGPVSDEVKYAIADSGYDRENSSIYISLKVELGCSESSLLPFSLRVVLSGLFKVDEELFDIANLGKWIQQSAIFILLPYARENVYALSLRGGLQPPVLLPLYSVPTLISTDQSAE